MSLNLGNCENDLTQEGLRLLREKIYADTQVDVVSWKFGYKDPY
jgi:hypothetical protein